MESILKGLGSNSRSRQVYLAGGSRTLSISEKANKHPIYRAPKLGSKTKWQWEEVAEPEKAKPTITTPAKNAKQEQSEEPLHDPALNEEPVYQKRGNVQLEDEEQEDAQPPEHEPGQEPAHAEPEAAKPAEADQEADADQAEADAGREQSRLEEQTRFFSSRETRFFPQGSLESPWDPLKDQMIPARKASKAKESC